MDRARRYAEDETEATFRDEIAGLCEREAKGERRALAELRERFSSDLAFGTGGIRGVIGGGSNRLNTLAVRRTTQGLAEYMKRVSPGILSARNLSAVVDFDSRRFSARFAREAALVLAANGIRAFLFDRLQPTPVLSFTVRRLGACAGIVITASHNPPEFNGYKVSWSDGAQIVGKVDEEITASIGRVSGPVGIMEESEALARGLLVILEEDALEPYYEMAERRVLRREEKRSRRVDLPIVYTPLHGAGFVPVTELFRRLGFACTVVPEQSRPDENFTHAPVPNPEFPDAFVPAFALAEKIKAGLVIATDPDADRLGAAVPDGKGFRLLSGNELGVLLLDYVLETLSEKKMLPARAYVVKSIVTTELQRRIAESRGVLCVDTLTGFKHICGAMRDMERKRPEYEFLFGNEESCGYLVEAETRDKDGVTAAAMTAAMAAFHAARGETLLDRLRAIHRRHGLFLDFQVAKMFPGAEGISVMRRLMEAFRRDPQALSPGERAVKVVDYLTDTARDMISGEIGSAGGLPRSDVLQVRLSGGGLITARPSGTESKIKFYASLRIDPPFDEMRSPWELEAKGDRIRSRIEEFVSRNSK
ncbi:MAG: phospho-sugar mutase [Spirochaetales bacterium]|nr:phospho-sugar mutase [Spirochaetales bacterium]